MYIGPSLPPSSQVCTLQCSEVMVGRVRGTGGCPFAIQKLREEGENGGLLLMEKELLSPWIILENLCLEVLTLHPSSHPPLNDTNQPNDWTYHSFTADEDSPKQKKMYVSLGEERLRVIFFLQCFFLMNGFICLFHFNITRKAK